MQSGRYVYFLFLLPCEGDCFIPQCGIRNDRNAKKDPPIESGDDKTGAGRPLAVFGLHRERHRSRLLAFSLAHFLEHVPRVIELLYFSCLLAFISIRLAFVLGI